MTADLGPAARPVPSPEDRMAAARTDTPTGRSFRTWMSDTDRDQLDAEVGRLQGELDEMRDARDVAKQLADFRQGVIDRHRQELGAAGDVLAVVRDAAERIDRALAVYDTTDVAAPASEIDRDGIKRHLVRTGLDGAVAEVERLTTERNQLVETIGRLVSLPPEQIAEIHKVGYSGSAPSSVPPRRVQEDEPRSSETDVPDWVLMLVAGLARYEAEHPKLYRHKGVDQVEPYPCPCSLLEGVPKAIREQATP